MTDKGVFWSRGYNNRNRQADIGRLKKEKMRDDNWKELQLFYKILCDTTRKQYGEEHSVTIDEIARMWYPSKWNNAKNDNRIGHYIIEDLRRRVHSMMHLVRCMYFEEPWVVIHKRIFLANKEEHFKFVHDRYMRFIKGSQKGDNRYLDIKIELARCGLLQ